MFKTFYLIWTIDITCRNEMQVVIAPSQAQNLSVVPFKDSQYIERKYRHNDNIVVVSHCQKVSFVRKNSLLAFRVVVAF